MLEPQLTDLELRVVRGMIDEYRYHQQRGKVWRSWWTTGKIVVAVVSGVVVVVVQITTLILLIHGSRH